MIYVWITANIMHNIQIWMNKWECHSVPKQTLRRWGKWGWAPRSSRHPVPILGALGWTGKQLSVTWFSDFKLELPPCRVQLAIWRPSPEAWGQQPEIARLFPAGLVVPWWAPTFSGTPSLSLAHCPPRPLADGSDGKQWATEWLADLFKHLGAPTPWWVPHPFASFDSDSGLQCPGGTVSPLSRELCMRWSLCCSSLLPPSAF